VYPEDCLPAGLVREWDCNDPVETAGAEEGRIQHVDTVGGSHDPDIAPVIEPVHLREELHQGPLDLGTSGSAIVGAGAPDCIDLVNEDDRGCLFPGKREELADQLRPFADVLVDELAP